jgi:nitrogen-specific signal transduction histidine kinase
MARPQFDQSAVMDESSSHRPDQRGRTMNPKEHDVPRVEDNGVASCNLADGVKQRCGLLRGISRELGDLLTIITGWVQHWEETTAENERSAASARQVYVGVARIRHSLNRLAHDPPTPGPLAFVDVHRVVESSLSSLDPRVTESYLLEKDLAASPWPVIADFWALDIVLMGLLMKAVEASLPGSPIFVETSNLETDQPVVGVGGGLPPGKYVTISVRDCAGLADLRDVPLARTEHADGALPLTLTLVREHAGLLQLRTAPTGDTTSTVFLPALADLSKPAAHLLDAEEDAT